MIVRLCACLFEYVCCRLFDCSVVSLFAFSSVCVDVFSCLFVVCVCMCVSLFARLCACMCFLLFEAVVVLCRHVFACVLDRVRGCLIAWLCVWLLVGLFDC